jgi:hypothetical protein
MKLPLPKRVGAALSSRARKYVMRATHASSLLKSWPRGDEHRGGGGGDGMSRSTRMVGTGPAAWYLQLQIPKGKMPLGQPKLISPIMLL